MDPEEQLLQQISLILMQTRFARRALEEIERNTARYGGVSFVNALSAGPRFGEPPLLDGALKVHVVNLSDLNPGTGLGGLIEGLLGGVGRFLGGFTGGLAGGAISAPILIALIPRITALMDTAERIVGQVREITREAARALEALARLRGSPPAEQVAESATVTGGNTLPAQTDMMRSLADLFRAAGSGEGGPPSAGPPESWLTTLYVIHRLVESISRLVDGLILLIPILVGAFAYLLSQIDVIKVKLLDLMQFALRNAFLLRGVALVVIYDTIAGIARLGAGIMRELNIAVTTVVAALFDAIGAVLRVAVEALRFIGGGLQRTMNGLLEWLRTGLGTFLIDIGRTDVFRLLHYLLRILPRILPALVVLVHDRSLNRDEMSLIQEAARMRLPGGQLTGGIPAFTPFPNIGDLLTPRAETEALTREIEFASTRIFNAVDNSFGAVERGLTGIERRTREAARDAAGLFAREDDPTLTRLRSQAGALADSLTPALDAARAQPASGLQAIADAYERWLVGGGLRSVLSSLEEHFRRTPTAGAAAERTLAARIVAAGAAVPEPPPVTIRIERVEVVVEPPTTPAADTEDGRTSLLLDMEDRILESDFIERIHDRLAVHQREWELRGGDPRFNGLAPAVSLG